MEITREQLEMIRNANLMPLVDESIELYEEGWTKEAKEKVDEVVEILTKVYLAEISMKTDQ